MLSKADVERWKVGRVVGAADVLFALAFINGFIAAVLLLSGLIFFGVVVFCLLAVLMLLFQYNVNSYFNGGG